MMGELTIRDYIYQELSPCEQEIALDFITYLEENHMTFFKDNGACWKDKIYYWVKLGDRCVCFIVIKDPDEPENHWTIWSEDMGSEWLENASVRSEIKGIVWRYVGHCGHCGSCSGGRRKVIFGKVFDDVCGCTFRVDNPVAEDLLFLKEMVEIRKKEIMENSN